MSRRLPALALALLLAAGLAGCGLGAGKSSTDARVLVTRDFGARELGAQIVQDVPESDTVMRLLERTFDVKTRYGGGFVQSIDGLAGGQADGKPVDWFFYVNGVESEVGGADADLHPGDRIWWDHHDWSATPHVPAVVGSFPDPFQHGEGGKRWPVVLECADAAKDACDQVSDRFSAVGVVAARQTLGTGVGEKTIRVLIGTWRDVGGDTALAQLDRGPTVSGVYARFTKDRQQLELLDQAGDVAQTLGAGAGLVAATRYAEQAPTWAITGTDAAGVDAAAAALDEQRLQRKFALAIDGPRSIGLPARG